MSTSDNERLVLGVHPVRELLRARSDAAREVLLQADARARLAPLGRMCADRQVSLRWVDRSVLDRAARGGQHQGAAAFAAPLPLLSVDALEIEPDLLAVAVDRITDPQNFGAVVRSAVALGSGEVIWGEHHAAPLTAATFRASAGAIEHARLYRVHSLHGVVQALGGQGVTTVGLDATAGVSLDEVDATGPVLLVVGAEDRGLTRAVRRACTTVASLPMPGPIGSLNASVAAAIALYATARSRREQRNDQPQLPGDRSSSV